MALDKKELGKFVAFVKKVKELPGNEEFIADLREVAGDNNTIASLDGIPSKQIEEIYEYCVEKVVKKQAEAFYKNFPIADIIPDLVKDFKRMESFRRKDNFEDFCLALYQQIECITNKLCELPSINNIAEKMWSCPAYIKTGQDSSQLSISNRTDSQYLIANLVFPGDNKKTNLPNAVEKSKQSLQTLYAMDKVRSIVYFLGYKAMMRDSDYYSYNNFTSLVSDIYAIRNMNHRGSTPNEYEQNRQAAILPQRYNYYLIYLGVLAQYVTYITKGLEALPMIEEYAKTVEKKPVPLQGPKVLGKIDLKPDNKKRFK